MSEIDYAEYVNTGSPTLQQVYASAQYGAFNGVPGLSIVVPPQGGYYVVSGFLPCVQSNYYISQFVARIQEIGGPRVAFCTMGTLPGGTPPPSPLPHLQTFGPLSLRARLPANGSTKVYELQVSRLTGGTPTNPNWTIVLDSLNENAAFICADTD